MIDTHTHLYMGAYSEPEQAPESLAGQLAAVERACAAGVGTECRPAEHRADETAVEGGS